MKAKFAPKIDECGRFVEDTGKKATHAWDDPEKNRPSGSIEICTQTPSGRVLGLQRETLPEGRTQQVETQNTEPPQDFRRGFRSERGGAPTQADPNRRSLDRLRVPPASASPGKARRLVLYCCGGASEASSKASALQRRGRRARAANKWRRGGLPTHGGAVDSGARSTLHWKWTGGVLKKKDPSSSPMVYPPIVEDGSCKGPGTSTSMILG